MSKRLRRRAQGDSGDKAYMSEYMAGDYAPGALVCIQVPAFLMDAFMGGLDVGMRGKCGMRGKPEVICPYPVSQPWHRDAWLEGYACSGCGVPSGVPMRVVAI